MALGIGGFGNDRNPETQKAEDNRIPLLIRSRDQGQTWSYARAAQPTAKKSSPAPSPTPSDLALLRATQIIDVIFHPSDPSIVFIGTKDAGLWKSADAGSQWRHTLDDPNGLRATSTVYRIAISPSRPGIVYLAVFQNHRGRVLKSIDAGQTFREVFFTPAPEVGIPALAVDPHDSDHVRIGTGQGGLIETADGGSTWATEKWFGGAITNFFMAPDDFDQMYITTAEGKIFEPNDQPDKPEEKWKDVTTTFAKSAMGRPRVQYSLFGGASITPATGQRIIADPDDFTSLYTTSANGISHSADAGKTWKTIDTLIPPGTSPDVRDIAVSPRDSSSLFAVANGQLHETKDGGKTWAHKQIPGIPGLRRIFVHPLQPDIFFALVGE